MTVLALDCAIRRVSAGASRKTIRASAEAASRTSFFMQNPLDEGQILLPPPVAPTAGLKACTTTVANTASLAVQTFRSLVVQTFRSLVVQTFRSASQLAPSLRT